MINIDIEDNMVLRSSNYKLSGDSEELLIKNKEAISSIKTDSPDIIENIGLNENLLNDRRENKKEISNSSNYDNKKMIN